MTTFNNLLLLFETFYCLLLPISARIHSVRPTAHYYERGKRPHVDADAPVGLSLRSTDATPEQLDAFKRSFLTKLGMNPVRDLTNVKMRTDVPDFLWDIYKEISEPYARSSEFSERTVRSVFPAQIAVHPARANTLKIDFNVSRIPQNEFLVESKLRIHLNDSLIAQTRFSLRVLELTNPCEDVAHILDSQTAVRHDAELSGEGQFAVVTFDVLPALLRQLSKPKVRKGEIGSVSFLVDVSLGDKQPKLWKNLIDLPQVATQETATLLLYSSDEREPRRAKRQTSSRHAIPAHDRPETRTQRRKNARRKSGRRRHSRRRYMRQNLCQRHRIYVDFRELNWRDWILAPVGYNAYFCGGACVYPLSENANTTNHAIVQSLVHSVTPGTVPNPCCVPTQMAPISMLYIDVDNRIVIKNYPDMIVEGCGCR